MGGGGQISPTEIKIIISLEPNVGFTSNEAVNLSNKIDKFGPWRDRGGPMEGPFSPRVP